MYKLKRTVVFFSTVDWDFLHQRHQHLAARLARAGHPVHYRNPRQTAGVPPEEAAPRLWVYRDFSLAPQGIMDDAIVFIYFPAHARWFSPDANKFIVYDCTDDFPDFTPHEEAMLGLADLVVCCSEPLHRKFLGRHPSVLYLPNGVEAEHFQSGGGPVPEDMRPLIADGKPILGFSGAMYPERVDAGLIFRLAGDNPHWRLVVIGETYQLDTSKAPSNLFFLGSRPYGVLPAYMRCFSTGLIPFHDNQIARGTDPIKLYEYVAADLPVVSRDLPFVRDLRPPLVYAYNTDEECVAAITRALAERESRAAEARVSRQTFIAQNSWDARVSDLLHALGKHTWLEGPG